MSDLTRAIMLTCESARLLMDARPDSDADQSILAEHLSGCASCSAYQDSQRALDRQLASTLVMEPPAWLTASIMEQLNPEPVAAWWAGPQVNLALQWSFYILLSGGLVLGLLLPIDSLTAWIQVLMALPMQLGVAFEVLTAVLGLVPLDPIVSALEDAAWLYESIALGLVFWWLRQGTSAREPRARA
jgi:hypothetical protein